MTKIQKSILLIIIVLIIDQVLKIWIKTNMKLGDEIYVLGNWFILHFTENNGMAFGMELGGDFGKVFLTIFRIIAIGGIGWYIWELDRQKAKLGLILSIALIFAGALGNIIDSVFYGVFFSASRHFEIAEFMPEAGGYASLLKGKVVDMFYFPILRGTYPSWSPINPNGSFVFFRPVFNIADTAISTGVGMIIVFHRRFFPKHEIEKHEDIEVESMVS